MLPKIIIRTLLMSFSFITVAESQSLQINNVTTVTPIANSQVVTRDNQWVEVIDGRITRISSSPIPSQNRIQVIDGEGKFLIPGLTDSHVHTQSMPGLAWDKPELEPLQQVFLAQQPHSFLYYGVTQILDPSLTPQAVKKFNHASYKPDLLFCGAAPIVGGYNLFDADIKDAVKRRPYFIHRPDKDGELPDGFNASNHTPEAVVERLKRDGAICIKVYIEDGFGLASDWPVISLDLLKRIRKAADDYGLLVFAHANALDMQQIALEAEVDVLAHGMWNWLREEHQTALPNAVKKIADDIVKNGIAYQPTLNVIRALRDVNVSDHLSLKGYSNVVPCRILDWYQSEQGQWFAKEMRQGWGTTDLNIIYNRQTAILDQGKRVLSYLYKQGHPMLLATDTPPAPTYASQPGLSAYMELQSMHNIGIKLPDLLIAATLNNAKMLGIENDYGTIEQGKVANLLLLEKNPLESVEAYDSIELVIVRGQSIVRDHVKVNESCH